MLKRYFIDEVTETRASRRQAFSLFSQVNGWADWCSVVRHARLFGGQLQIAGDPVTGPNAIQRLG